MADGSTKFRLDYSLGLAMGVETILIVLIPPQTDAYVCTWLIVLAATALYPTLHFVDWVCGGRKALTRIVGPLLVTIFICAIGYKMWPEFKSLRDLSNYQIKQRTSSFVSDLEKLQANFDQKMINETANGKISDTEKNFTIDFNANYRGTALALRSDLLRRLGRPEPPLNVIGGALSPAEMPLAGILAGAYPLENLGAYLQQLANELPD
jgi:hypothetical protein